MSFRYIDDVLSINNSRFAEFLPLIYPPELAVKETTDTASSASFLDLYFEFDDSGRLSTKIYDKRDDLNFKIINFPNMLLDQGYYKIRLIRSLKKFIFRYQDLVEIYSVSAEKIKSDAFSYSENV